MTASRTAAGPLSRITRAGLWALALVPFAAGPVLPTVTGHLHALTVFARFQGEGGGAAAPEFASRLFAVDQPGSLTHYFNEMSRGQYRLTGESLPGWVSSGSPVEGYLPPAGTFGRFSREILAQADAQVDLARFDDDGPDGLPASGDDDGYVDFVFVVTRSSPRDFIVDAATGIAALGLGEEYVSNDRDPARPGGRIRVRADQDPHGVGGVLQQGSTFEVAVGNMAHEFGHHLGLVDLYDLQYGAGPEDDSAGVGYWDLMAHGARGWGDREGPNPLSAWSLMQLGWLGVANSQLVEVQHDLLDAALVDVNAGGKVYQLKTRTAGVYYLVEHRRRGTSFYERNLPAEGVMIWRVDESRVTNNDEEYKRVDLICADGTFADAGVPLGLVPDPVGGQDNLDYWAHDEGYRQVHAGNLGDAGDPFDGDRHTEFSVVTNPAATAGIAVSRIRRQGQGMVADLRVGDRRRAGPLTDDEVWSDTVEVVGDVTVPQGRTLTISPETVVHVGVDALRTGRNPERVEVEVQGDLVTAGGSRGQVVITSAAARPAPGDWYGLVVHPLGRISLWQVLLEYPVYGIVTAGSGLRRPLELNAVVVRNALRDGLALEGVEQAVELVSVQVHDSGERGIRVEGSGYTRISLPHLTGNRAGGLEVRGGYLECRDGRFADNGLSTADGANLVLGEEVFGEVSGSTLSGGIGIYCLGTQEVVVTGNQFDRCRIGLVSLSAVPRVTGNSFAGTELVARVEGFAVPARFDLNVVQEAARLVDNQTDRTMAATNNWWGRIDENWIAARMSGPVVWKPYLNFDPRREIGFSLAQNHPNPFNGSTAIGYTVGINAAIVSGRARTVLEVRSIAGGLVRRLVDEAAAPGIFTATWDGRDESGARSASGVYYLQLQVGPLRELRPLVLLK